MSCNYRAGQYEKTFLPRRLGNWQVPAHFPSRVPLPRQTPTKIIADDNGRLLNKFKKGRPAWTPHPTAWDYPNRFNSEQAERIRQQIIQGKLPVIENPQRKSLDPNAELTKENQEEIIQLDECNLKENINRESRDNKLLPIASTTDNTVPPENNILQEEESEIKIDSMKDNVGRSMSLPIASFPGFFYARKMHMDNLLHQPLPDAMALRKVHANLKEPGHDLDVKPYSAPWNRSENIIHHERPLTCSKLQKVNSKMDKFNSLRPATSGGEKNLKNMTPIDLAICWEFRCLDPRDEPKRPKHIDGSNGSLAPAVFSMVHSPKDVLDLQDPGKTNPIFSQTDTLIDDKFVPSFEKNMSKNKHRESCDVPKCPQHYKYEKQNRLKELRNKVDKNGTESHSKTINKKRNGSCDGIHGCGTPENSNSPSNSASLKNHKESTRANGRRNSLDNSSNNNDSFDSFIKKKNCRSSPNVSKCDSDNDSSTCKSKDVRLYSSKIKRECMACNDRNNNLEDINCKKSTSTNSSENKTSNSSKNSYKVPKMRDPYSKKSYGVPTLAPPFSRWKDGSGYPEHWRLASIYQHAYKPPDNRRRPLLPSVYQ